MQATAIKLTIDEATMCARSMVNHKEMVVKQLTIEGGKASNSLSVLGRFTF